ncbi:MAG: BLUF domain-containing protein [Pseudomonadota bacterium]
MKRALYLSQASVSFTDEELEDLAVYSAFNNRQKDVTGYLCFSRNTFFQFLEGDDKTVDGLLHTIRNDARHTFINQIESRDNNERLFSSWSMKYLSYNDLSTISLENYVVDNMLYLKSGLSDKQRCLRLLWNQIRLISLLHDSQMMLERT